jgi:nitrate reductase gamma subunit
VSWLIAQRLPMFWRMMVVVGVLVVLGFRRWLELLAQGHDGTRPGIAAGWAGLWQALRSGPAVGWRRALAHVLADGLLHKRLYHRSKVRWLAHAGLLVGFFGLMSLSALAAFADHILRPLGLAPGAVAIILNKDHPLMALPNEIFGLFLLAGGVYAGLRRLFWRGPYLPSERPDVLALSLLFFITLSGYPLESLRLLAEAVPVAAARYSFIGLPLSRLLAPLGLPWAAWHFWLFQAHVIAAASLFIYWPFS